MATIKLGDKDYELACGAWTPVLYEQEFGKDMIADVFGRVAFREDDMLQDGEIAVMDFRDTNWTASIRALWACMKTADDSVEPFNKWIKKQDGIDLEAVQEYISTELVVKFFPTRAAETKE